VSPRAAGAERAAVLAAPADALADALISVTPETSTSIRLLQAAARRARGLPGVRFVRGLEPAQADGCS
jgi:hypothetical protein